MSRASDSGLAWKSLESKAAYKSLPTCAQTCLLNAYTAVDPGCVSYGCVCSENTLGPNYLASWKYVTDCTAKGCPDGDVASIKVGNAFRDICAEAIDLYTLQLPQPTNTIVANTSSTDRGSSTVSTATSTSSSAPRPTITGEIPVSFSLDWRSTSAES